MCFLLSGAVSVLLSLDGNGRTRRLATLGPGVAFGEMALLDEGRRSAARRRRPRQRGRRAADRRLRTLGSREPHLARTLYANLARNLSHRVRSANGQLRALDQ